MKYDETATISTQMYLRMLKNKLRAQNTVTPVPKNDESYDRILWSDNHKTCSNGKKHWIL